MSSAKGGEETRLDWFPPDVFPEFCISISVKILLSKKSLFHALTARNAVAWNFYVPTLYKKTAPGATCYLLSRYSFVGVVGRFCF